MQRLSEVYANVRSIRALKGLLQKVLAQATTIESKQSN